jgi:NAD-dependent dihydropyrimidine dehydrogenase PreA subunit
VNVCPSEIYKLDADKLVLGNTADCSGCQSCVSVCANQAITVTEV